MDSQSWPFFFSCRSANTYRAPTVGQAWSQDGGSLQPESSSPVVSTQPQATVPASEEAGSGAGATTSP